MPILEVPYLYTRTGYLPRHKTPERRRLVSTLVLRVPELTEAQAPLVGRCNYQGKRIVFPHNPDGRLEHMFSQDTMLETDYRMLDGQLMRRLVPDRQLFKGALSHSAVRRAREPRFAATTAAILADPDSVGLANAQGVLDLLRANLDDGHALVLGPNMGKVKPEHYRDLGVVEEADDPFARIVGDDRADSMAHARSSLGRAMAFVDGALYVPSQGPAWLHKYRTQFQERRTVIIAEAMPEIGWLGDNHVSAYLASDLDTCLSVANNLEETRSGSIDIEDSAYGRVHPDEYAARATADMVLNAGIAGLFAAQRHADGLEQFSHAMRILSSPEPSGPELSAALGGLRNTLHAMGQDVRNAVVNETNAITRLQRRGAARAVVDQDYRVPRLG